MKKRIIIGLYICCLALVNVTAAQKYTAEFLNLGVGVRALGMGSAFTGISDDVTASYWNPAGLSQFDRPEITLMRANMFEGEGEALFNYNYFSAVTHKIVLPYWWKKTKSVPGSFAISYLSLTVPKVPYLPENQWRNDLLAAQDYSTLAGQQTYVDATDTALFLSYSFPQDFLVKWMLFGLNLKVINSSLSSASASGVGLDIGMIYTGLRKGGLTIGLNLQDITNTPVAWSGVISENHTASGVDNIPLSVKLGIAYDLRLPFTTDSCVALDIDSKDGSNVSLGTELWFADVVALRLGYRQLSGASTVNNITAGLGFKFFSSYTVDYAFMTHDALGGSQRIALTFSF